MLVAACEGITSLAELRANPIENRWLASLPAPVTRLPREEVPEEMRLGGGWLVPVHYQSGQAPWIESRLQDFFGMPAGPSICGGTRPTRTVEAGTAPRGSPPHSGGSESHKKKVNLGEVW